MKTVEDIALEAELIFDLQKIDAGIINGLTPILVEAITAIKLHYNYPIEEICTICGTDLAIYHHIKSYKGRRSKPNDESLFDGYIGYIWICPNCHYRIHNRNYYFTCYRGKY